MDAYFAVFDQYLADKLPSVYKHFENLAIPKQSFLVEWFYTVYARAFNLVVSSKVWDYFLFEGDVFLIKLAIAILAILENELLNSEYEVIDEICRTYCSSFARWPIKSTTHNSSSRCIKSRSNPVRSKTNC